MDSMAGVCVLPAAVAAVAAVARAAVSAAAAHPAAPAAAALEQLHGALRRTALRCVGPAAREWRYAQYPYVSVKLCSPGTSTCATIDDVLVDTGSVGCADGVGLALPVCRSPTPLMQRTRNSIAECLPFAMATPGARSRSRCQHGG